MYRNTPDPARTVLSICFWNSKKHPPTNKHPFWETVYDCLPNFCTQTNISTLFSRALIVFRYVLVIQGAVEQIFVWQFSFFKALLSIHVFVRINSFLTKPSLLPVLCESWGVLQVLPRSLFLPVNPATLAKSSDCLEYTLSSRLLFSTFPDQMMGIASLKIVENDRHKILFRLYP